MQGKHRRACYRNKRTHIRDRSGNLFCICICIFSLFTFLFCLHCYHYPNSRKCALTALANGRYRVRCEGMLSLLIFFSNESTGRFGSTCVLQQNDSNEQGASRIPRFSRGAGTLDVWLYIKAHKAYAMSSAGQAKVREASGFIQLRAVHRVCGMTLQCESCSFTGDSIRCIISRVSVYMACFLCAVMRRLLGWRHNLGSIVPLIRDVHVF